MNLRSILPLFIALAFTQHCWADEALAAKLRALFGKADQDANGSLSEIEQQQAIAYVKKTYGADWATKVDSMLKKSSKETVVSAEAWEHQVRSFAAAGEKKTEMLAMRDGTLLATDLYFPAGNGPFSVVLARTPYARAKRGSEGDSFVRDGSVFVIQDMRGRFDSQGENLPFNGCGWSQHQDGFDTIAWLRKQSWCNGKIATIGGSAGGITQNMLAATAPEGLRAQYISVAAASLFSDAAYIGGAFRKADLENWTRDNKFLPQALQDMLSRPSYDDYWARFDTTKRFGQMNVPAIHIGGWFDMFAQGTIDEFIGRQHHGAAGSKGTQKLIMGPWAHAIGKMPVGELTFPKATRLPSNYEASRWFAHYLHGLDNGVEKEPAVAYYVMGDTSTASAPGNEWRFAQDWPIPAKETAIYFTSERRLSWKKPTASTPPLEFTFDPAQPCPTLGGTNLTLPSGPVDQRPIESRPDVLVFTSAPLTKPVEITGQLTAKLFVSSSALDTDISLRLCDVYPDGRSLMMAEGIRRLRYRNSQDKPEPLTPGKVEEITIDCWSTSLILNAGHSARIIVTSSNYPHFDLNPGTGQPWSETGEKVKQTNRIYCSPEHPSRLMVPIVE